MIKIMMMYDYYSLSLSKFGKEVSRIIELSPLFAACVRRRRRADFLNKKKTVISDNAVVK